MLQFRKSGYTRKEIKVLLRSILVGYSSIICKPPIGCDECENKKVCSDLSELIRYLESLLYDENIKAGR